MERDVAGAMNRAQQRQVGLGRDDHFSRQVSHGVLHPCDSPLAPAPHWDESRGPVLGLEPAEWAHQQHDFLAVTPPRIRYELRLAGVPTVIARLTDQALIHGHEIKCRNGVGGCPSN